MSKKKTKCIQMLEKIIPPAKKPWYVFWRTKPVFKNVEYISMEMANDKETDIEVFLDNNFFGISMVKKSDKRRLIKVKAKKPIKIDPNIEHKVKVLFWINNK